MKMKRIAALFCAAAMAAGMIGCGAAGNGAADEAKAPASADTVSAEPETGAEGDEDPAAPTDAIRIATKPMTEQFILSEMLKQIIEDSTDYTVEITKGIGGGTNNIQPAMEKGEFDLYPEYTSSGYVMVLDHDAVGVSDNDMWEQLQEEYGEKFNFSWVSHYGFNNTYAVAVRKETADAYNLKTTSDLAKVADQLIFGGNPDYIEREDGFNLLCETYGLNFKDVKDIDIGLKYEALFNGDIDVTNGFTTDAQLGSDDVVVLEDDLHLQANYFCSTVVRNEALEKYPDLEEALMKMDGILSDKEMAQLNYKVEVDGMDEATVAHDYLADKGVIAE